MVKEILVCFKGASGQQVNFQKSAICFSRNIKRSDQEYLASVLGVVRVGRHEKYLGLPTFVDQNRGACFSHIKKSLWKKLQGWKGKTISAAAKELLVKVVAQSIPLYSMSCYLLP